MIIIGKVASPTRKHVHCAITTRLSTQKLARSQRQKIPSFGRHDIYKSRNYQKVMATCKCIKQPDVLISYTCKPIKETDGPNSYAHLISMVWSSRISWANSQRSWINSLEKAGAGAHPNIQYPFIIICR